MCIYIYIYLYIWFILHIYIHYIICIESPHTLHLMSELGITCPELRQETLMLIPLKAIM